MTVTYCAADTYTKFMLEDVVMSAEAWAIDMSMAAIEPACSDSLWLVPGTFSLD